MNVIVRLNLSLADQTFASELKCTLRAGHINARGILGNVSQQSHRFTGDLSNTT
jgi:hypothetical protein